MKVTELVVAVAFLAPAGVTFAQSSGMKGMEMKNDMKGMEVSKDKSQATHKAIGVVKKVDPKAGTVTLDHGPVKSMNWPAMQMAFKVEDKTMLDKLAEGKKVEVEFLERGKEHVITSVK
jgi:Cu(I)/Ag(I) efflux system protein CusF